MTAWVFVLVLLMADGEVRETKSERFGSWQDCELARIAEAGKPMTSDVHARILRRCRADVKA
jgi:hypothetical protein